MSLRYTHVHEEPIPSDALQNHAVSLRPTIQTSKPQEENLFTTQLKTLAMLRSQLLPTNQCLIFLAARRGGKGVIHVHTSALVELYYNRSTQSKTDLPMTFSVSFFSSYILQNSSSSVVENLIHSATYSYINMIYY